MRGFFSPAALEHMDVPVRRSGVPVAPGARNGRICGVGIRLETIAYQGYAHAFSPNPALQLLRSRRRNPSGNWGVSLNQLKAPLMRGFFSPAALEHMDVPVRRSGVPVAPGARNGRICGVGIRLETIAYQGYAHAFSPKPALLSRRSRRRNLQVTGEFR